MNFGYKARLQVLTHQRHFYPAHLGGVGVNGRYVGAGWVFVCVRADFCFLFSFFQEPHLSISRWASRMQLEVSFTSGVSENGAVVDVWHSCKNHLIETFC